MKQTSETNGRVSELDGPGGWSLAVIGICAVIYFLDGVIHTVLGPMAPEIARDLSLDNVALGPIFSANLIGQTIGLVSFPLLANRFGHRAVMVLAVIGFGIAQAGTALAQGATGLFVYRLATGVFLGGCLPSCLAIVTFVAPPARRGLAVTMLFTGYGAGATVAGIVATAFANFGGWRAASVFIGLVCLGAALLAWFWLHGVDPQRADVADRPEEKTRAINIVSPHLLLGTVMLWLLFISMLTINYCLSSWLPTLLVQVGYDHSFAALSVTVFSLGGIIAALGVGVLIDRFGAIPVLVTFLTLATGLLLTTGQVLASASPTALMALLVTGGFFFLGAYGGVNVVLASYYPEALRAVGIGWTKSVGRIGTIIAPVLIGQGLAAGIAETTIMSLFALPCALAVVALLVIGAQSRRENAKARHRPI